MKIKQWLKEYKNMSFAEYKALPDIEKWDLQDEHKRFLRNMQLKSNQKWLPLSEEEKEHYRVLMEEERRRYETNLKIGGIDDLGNYTALHHRNG